MRNFAFLFILLLTLSSCKNPLGKKSDGQSAFDDGHVAFPVKAELKVFSLNSAVAGDTRVILTWEESKNAKSYEVYYGISSANNDTQANMCSGGSLTCTVTGLTNNQQYFFIVRAKNSIGTLDSTNELDATPVANETAPVASNITPTNGSEDVESTVTLSYVDGQGDLATSCNVNTLSNITITTACACTAGVCGVGVTGTSNYSGTVGFSYTVTANGLTSNTATASFSLNTVNDAPTISNVANQTIEIDETSTGALAVTIGDIDSTLTCLGSLSASSSNKTLIDSGNIAIGGTAPNCTVNLTPKTNQTGTATVTLTVTDGVLTATDDIALTVAFSPDTLSNLVLWGDASDASTLYTDAACSTLSNSGGDSIACWADKSLEGNNMLQSLAGSRPTRDSNNGVLDFSGSQYFQTANDPSFNFLINNGYTYFIVANSVGGAGVRCSISSRIGENGFILCQENDANTFFIRNADGWNALNSLNGNGKRLYMETNEFGADGSRFVSVDGNETDSPGISDPFMGSQVVAVGARPGGGFPWSGDISEVLIYNDSMSLSDRQKVAGYLACKWGLQASLPPEHPYKSICP